MGKGFLSGYKTYILGTVTIVLAVLAYTLNDEVAGQVVLELPELVQLIVTAILGMTVRNGIANK